MNLEELLDTYGPFLRKYALPLAVGFIGLILLGYGVMTLSAKSPSGSLSQTAQDASISAKYLPQTSQKPLFIDVEGAVMKPGVYQLKPGSRMQDGLIAAGGLSANADRAAVAKSLNLALAVLDGTKIYIPATGEQVIIAGSSVAGATGGIVNINQASEADLDGLPGIGLVTAQKIIDGRPYQTTNDLVQKKVIGKATFDKIKDLIVAQ